MLFRLPSGHRAVVVRERSHRSGRYAVQLAGRTLDADASAGDHALDERGGAARLELLGPLPPAVRAAHASRRRRW